MVYGNSNYWYLVHKATYISGVLFVSGVYPQKNVKRLFFPVSRLGAFTIVDYDSVNNPNSNMFTMILNLTILTKCWPVVSDDFV